MYQIYFNDLPIYDPRGAELNLTVRNPGCHLAVGEAGSLDFVIDPDHPYAGELTRLTGVVELRADGVPIYKGRIISDTQKFDLSRSITTEGLMACLNDSIIPPFTFPDDFLEDAAYVAAAESGNVIEFFLGWLLDTHNSQVGPAQQLQLGTVTVADPNNYIVRASSEYLTSMEALRQKVTTLLGGYLVADYSGPVTTLHYYADLPLTNTQTVEFGENLLDLTTLVDAAETYTAILPVGAEGLTLDSLPDGELTPGFFKSGLIIYSEDLEAQYGGCRIVRKASWDDVTLASNLQTKALAQLSSEGVMLNRTISVKAADLAGTDGVDFARFTVGRYVQLQSTPHGFSAAYPLTELNPDILNPANTNITLGATIKTASDIVIAAQNANSERLNLQQLELNKQQAGQQELTQVSQTSITTAVQTAQGIILSALENYVKTSNYNQFKSTVESQLAVLANEITLKFSQANTSIQDVNTDLQQTVSTLTKYFEFTLDGLAIKAGEGTMNLVLDNDMILFKKGGQQFGWWDGVNFHTGNIVIAVNERAQLGNFAFVPRSNGSLSFLKVGD